MNPLYGDLDTYHMAASSIDEAVRNAVAVGADPSRIGILDNFCWGYTDRPETLGSLVRAALACQDVAVAFRTPFISGKDSLNNEFSFTDPEGKRQTISIPSTLLISALGQVPNISQCVSMDLKAADNVLYLLGPTDSELGGSHALLVHDRHGEGRVPTVNASRALAIFQSLHAAINLNLVRSCHDLSEGGLAACLAEMCFAGDLGAEIDISSLITNDGVELSCFERLFAESNSRFVCEVPMDSCEAFEKCFPSGILSRIGFVRSEPLLSVRYQNDEVLRESIAALKNSWPKTFDWK
jgi:phosphoribosylformylglycinamidine synthase